MKELSDILEALRGRSGPAVLVTVVAVEGSTYRRPGARMLVSPERPGGRIGSISGGCLEDEACRRGMYLTDRGPSVVMYETGLDDGGPGAGTSYTLGCGGRVTALFERVEPAEGYLRFVDAHRGRGGACVVATVIAAPDEEARWRLGDRPFLKAEDGSEVVGPDGECLRAEVEDAIESGRSRVVTLEGGHVLVEYIPAPVHLFLFGSGHDVEPVARLGANLGWRVTIVAPQPAKGRLTPIADVVSSADGARLVRGSLPRRSAAIVMNHHYERDSEAVATLLSSGVAYVGILGPRHRTDAMLSDVASSRQFDAAGVAARMDLSRVHAPIGLDIGAETPEEVALAIIAEVQAFFAGRDGGRLRDRPGAIHPTVQGAVSAPVVNAACSMDGSP